MICSLKNHQTVIRKINLKSGGSSAKFELQISAKTKIAAIFECLSRWQQKIILRDR